MIIGVDHIALNVSDAEMDAMRKHLVHEGFRCVFWEDNVPNHPEKKIFLSHYQPTHSLGLFSSNQGGVSLEITNHGSIAEPEAAFHYHEVCIELLTPNLELERSFWKNAFAFQDFDSDSLMYTSFVPNWSCRLKLIEKKNMGSYTLDSDGYTCCALLTNNLEGDLAQAQLMGAQGSMRPFKLELNKQHLDVVMFRTPGGAICELIQINREGK